MKRIMMFVLSTVLVAGALLGASQLASAYWGQYRPLHAFCQQLGSVPAEERLDRCADQNTTGAVEFRCVASPYKDAYGKVAYTFQIRLLGDESSTCSVGL